MWQICHLILSSDELKGAESQAELPGIVCHFFFKDDINGILALQAVLHQLFTQSPSSIEHAMGEYNSKGKGFTKEFDTLWNIFLDVISDSESRIVICVLDALDECSHSTRGATTKSNHETVCRPQITSSQILCD